MKRFLFGVCKLSMDRVFLNDSIHNGDTFIVIFEAYGPVVKNREYFQRKSIGKADFCNFNPFCRTVIHEGTFGTFQMF